MNTMLFLKEMKREFRNFIIATSIVIVYIALTMVIYSSMEIGMDKITDIWASLPEGFQTALNFSGDSWSTILGFYATYFVFYVPLIAGGFSAVWGLKMLSKEEQNKTAEFLLAKPISRDQILTSKLALILFYILVINILAYLTGMITCEIVDSSTSNATVVSIMHLYGLVACIFFMALGLFISTMMKRSKTNVGIGIGIVVGSYLIDMVLKISDKAEFLLYLTPFKYINLDVNNPDYHIEGWRILIPLGVSVLLIGLSYLFYRKKDILV